MFSTCVVEDTIVYVGKSCFLLLTAVTFVTPPHNMDVQIIFLFLSQQDEPRSGHSGHHLPSQVLQSPVILCFGQRQENRQQLLFSVQPQEVSLHPSPEASYPLLLFLFYFYLNTYFFLPFSSCVASHPSIYPLTLSLASYRFVFCSFNISLSLSFLSCPFLSVSVPWLCFCLSVTTPCPECKWQVEGYAGQDREHVCSVSQWPDRFTERVDALQAVSILNRPNLNPPHSAPLETGTST